MTEHEVVEICAGAGGQSLGLHLGGFRHRLAVELDESAARTLRTNLARRHPPHDGSPRPDALVCVGDVADERVWRPEEHRGVALLAGGVPCPPFSVAGRQLGASDERDLFAWAVEAAGRMEPRAVLLENVRGLASPRFAGYRQAIADRLHDLGYWSEWRLLHAADFGVPQLRPRFVLVALRPADVPYWSWPRPRAADVTVGQVLVDLMAAGGWRWADQWAERADEIAPTIVGGSKRHGGADLGPTRAKKAWARLGVDAWGIADAPPGPDDPEEHRPQLTTKMVARLQGWIGPEYHWQFRGRKTSVYRQIGNAFPPPVARALAVQIRGALDHTGEVTLPKQRSTVHDLVYRILRDAGPRFLTERLIIERSDGLLRPEEVHRRLALLRHDFVVTDASINGEPAWRIEGFRAFRGQRAHPRQNAFSDPAQLSRIS